MDFEYKIIGLNRDRKDLFIRIDKRIEEMFENGFIKEVEKLLSEGLFNSRSTNVSDRISRGDPIHSRFDGFSGMPLTGLRKDPMNL